MDSRAKEAVVTAMTVGVVPLPLAPLSPVAVVVLFSSPLLVTVPLSPVPSSALLVVAPLSTVRPELQGAAAQAAPQLRTGVG